MSFSNHKLYDKHQREWQYFRDSYDLEPDLRNKRSPLTGESYITRFRLESPDDFADRVKKAIPVDICTPGIDLMVGSISDIHSEIPDQFQEIWEDADLQDTSMLQVMMDARTKACIYGSCGILIDSTKAESEIVTEADVINSGIRPFVRLLTPLDIINWRLDANGNILEVLYTCTPEQTGSILESSETEITQYRYWSATEWRVYNDETLVESGVNPLGRVPLVMLYHKKVQPMIGSSLIKQASKYQQTLTNWLSNIDRIQELQSFALPVLTSENKPAEVGVGVSTILHLRPSKKDGTDITGAESFAYIAPDVAPLSLAWDSFYKVLSQALASMALPGDVFEQSKTSGAESGVAKSYRWSNTTKRLVSMSLNEQEALRTVMYLCAEWMGTTFDGSISYPTTFDMTSLDNTITNLLALSSAGLPSVAKAELMKQALTEALPRLDEAKRQEINEALDNMSNVESRVSVFAGE